MSDAVGYGAAASPDDNVDYSPRHFSFTRLPVRDGEHLLVWFGTLQGNITPSAQRLGEASAALGSLTDGCWKSWNCTRRPVHNWVITVRRGWEISRSIAKTGMIGRDFRLWLVNCTYECLSWSH